MIGQKKEKTQKRNGHNILEKRNQNQLEKTGEKTRIGKDLNMSPHNQCSSIILSLCETEYQYMNCT